MDCNRTSELLSEYIDGILDAETEAKVEKHIEVCQRCREEYQLLMSIIDECHQIDEIDLPDDFHRKLHDRLVEDSKDQKRIKANGGWRRYYTAAAAVLVLVISLGMVINSGILNMGSGKKSESAIDSKEMVRQDMAATPQIAANGVEESPASEAASAPEERTTMKSAAIQGTVLNENVADTQQRMVYNVLTINLSGEEYNKYIKDLGVVIESMGGFVKSEEPASYMMPEDNMGEFLNKLRETYNINNVILSQEDITEKYKQIEQEISRFTEEYGDANGADDGKGEADKQKIEKEQELNDLNSRLGYVIIQINRN